MDEFAKVAALLSHLDSRSRSEILARLPVALRAELDARSAAAPLPQPELVQIVAEYQAVLRGLSAAAVAETPGDTRDMPTSAPAEEPGPSAAPLARLTLDPAVEAARMAELLAGERAATIAGIVSHLAEADAVAVFALLPEERRLATLPLLPNTGTLSPLVLDELQQWLDERGRPVTPRNTSGMSLLARLLRSREAGVSDLPRIELSAADQELLQRLVKPQ